MKILLFTIMLLGYGSCSSAQYKIVKIIDDSLTLYFRYFNKSKNASEETRNDTLRFVGRKINDDVFYLDKYSRGKKLWTKICTIELATDSLRITTRISGGNGKSRFEYTKEPYYLSHLTNTSTNTTKQTFTKTVALYDSIATQIDSDKTFTIAVSEGSSEDDTGFSFCFYIYYRKELKTVSKATYSCDSTFKTFYYKNDELIKIISDGNSYYYFQKTLYAVDGMAVDKPVSEELLELSNMPLKGMEEFFKRMRK